MSGCGRSPRKPPQLLNCEPEPGTCLRTHNSCPLGWVDTSAYIPAVFKGSHERASHNVPQPTFPPLPRSWEGTTSSYRHLSGVSRYNKRTAMTLGMYVLRSARPLQRDCVLTVASESFAEEIGGPASRVRKATVLPPDHCHYLSRVYTLLLRQGMIY